MCYQAFEHTKLLNSEVHAKKVTTEVNEELSAHVFVVALVIIIYI